MKHMLTDSRNTYQFECSEIGALPYSLDTDEVGKRRNTIVVSTNDTSNMRPMTYKVIVDLIREIRLVARSSAAKVSSTAPKEAM